MLKYILSYPHGIMGKSDPTEVVSEDLKDLDLW